MFHGPKWKADLYPRGLMDTEHIQTFSLTPTSVPQSWGKGYPAKTHDHHNFAESQASIREGVLLFQLPKLLVDYFHLISEFESPSPGLGKRLPAYDRDYFQHHRSVHTE